MKTCLIILLHLSLLFPQVTNIRVSSASSSDPEEVAIAVNPVNPNILAAGANISYFYASTNAGMNWTQKKLTSSLGVWGDPCVIFDGLNNLYFGHLSNPLSGYWIDRIVIQKSSDYGVTWNDGAGIGYNYPKNQDKEWLAVDLSTPQYKNYLYCTWTEFDNYGSSSFSDSSRILFSRSTNSGATWLQPVRVSDKGGNCIDEDLTVEGAVPTVGVNGEIYTAWSGPLGIMFDKSTNGGLTWGNDIFVSDQPGGWDYTIPGINRSNGLPVTICDTSHSPFRGHIYVMWGDQRNGTSNSDVYLIKSTDGGNTWVQRVKVNDDVADRHQFFPWMAIDQTTGIIYVVFYDRRSTTGSVTDVYLAKSTDGGATFANFKISQSSFTPTASVFFGDYSNIAAHNRKVYPIWMRMDGTALSVWNAVYSDTSTVLPVELTGFRASVNDGKVLLTWETSSELNNKGFEVERKIPNLNDPLLNNWHTIAFVPGHGSLSGKSNYSFTDDEVIKSRRLYRLKQIDFSGAYSYSREIEVESEIPASARLFQNYPNPFNPSTTIGFELVSEEQVRIMIYDPLGNEIERLLDKSLPAGVHEVDFTAQGYSSGVFLVRLIAGKVALEKKMLYLR